MNATELSVIVPTFNEEKTVPALIDSLARQRDIRFELIISDGGSTDATGQTALLLGRRHGIDIEITTGEKGRGDQLNRGAKKARGRFLLFLHADSLFEDPWAFRTGVDTVAAAAGESTDDIAAGRYALRFRRTSRENPMAYYFYECKARLNRPGCSHGDQGIIVPKHVFAKIGPLRAFPPMLAETRFTDEIRDRGNLLLIPSEIFTSARRFETEGLYQRQVMNAILMNCADLGWDEPFHLLPELYRLHDRSGKLLLSPQLEKIQEQIAYMEPLQRSRFWSRTGGYVRKNAWQIPFFFDTRRNFRRRLPAGTGPTPLLDRFDRWWNRVTDNPAGRLAAAWLTMLWFHATRISARRCERLKCHPPE